MSEGGGTLLELRGVEKRWGDRVIFSGVDLELAPGHLTWLAGDNGVGKTTLLRVATGIIVPDAGEVRAGGLHPERDRRAFHRRVGFLPAGDRGLYARLTARQNIDFSASLAFLRGAEKRAAVDAGIARFGIEPFEHQRVDRISMGQRQRVRLAVTLLHEPDVVLLDEPRTSLDAAGIALVSEAIAALIARGGTALYCSPTGDASGLEPDQSFELRSGKLVPA